MLESPCIIIPTLTKAAGLPGPILSSWVTVKPVVLVNTLEIITPALEIIVNTINKNNNNCKPHGYDLKYFIFNQN